MGVGLKSGQVRAYFRDRPYRFKLMNKEILYPIALDEKDKLIHIDNAEKGMHFFCPVCKKEFILRKSGKTGKGARRPHFAHNESGPNCTLESVLHCSFKRLLSDLLKNYKEENRPFFINWYCSICGYKNSENLLAKVASIKKEYALEACRPDIALLDTEENVLAVIEIVVAHKPEEAALQYYKNNKIVLIQIELSSEGDLKTVEENAANPDLVDFCISPTCHNHDRYKVNRNIRSEYYQCGRCFSWNEKYYIEIDNVFGKKKSLSFSKDEINIVKSKRTGIEIKINKDKNEKYPFSVCINCKRIQSRYGSPRL